MLKRISSTFLRGLAAVLPLAVTVYALFWLATTSESLMRDVMQRLFPKVEYFPGLGILFGFCLIYLIGFILQLWIAASFFRFFERLLEKLPLVHTIYGSMKDLLGFFGTGKDDKKSQAVAVTIAGTRLVGLVTRDQFDDLPEGIGRADDVAVFLPMSYQLGGFTVMVPRDEVTPIDLTTEQALRFCVTAGMSTTEKSAVDKAKQLPPAD